MTLLNALLLVTLLIVALLTALILEQNRQAELEARLELIRLARFANRQRDPQPVMRRTIDQPQQVFLESHGFFKIVRSEGQDDSSNLGHAA